VHLHRGSGAQGGVERQVVDLAVSGAGLNVAPAFAVGAREGTAAALIAGQLVELGI
jgi:hypothetical protein